MAISARARSAEVANAAAKTSASDARPVPNELELARHRAVLLRTGQHAAARCSSAPHPSLALLVGRSGLGVNRAHVHYDAGRSPAATPAALAFEGDGIRSSAPVASFTVQTKGTCGFMYGANAD